jgi:hypothetical protein
MSKTNASTGTTNTNNKGTSTTENATAKSKGTIEQIVTSVTNTTNTKMGTNTIMQIFAAVAFSIGSIVFFGLAFTNLSTFLGNKDKWQAIKDQLKKVLPYTLGGSICLFAVAMVYFRNNQENIIYFMMILLCISIILSYTALYVSSVTN